MVANARRDKWIMVRLKRTTHKALIVLGELWQRVAERDSRVPASGDRDRVSVNDIVAELLRRDAEHRRRSQRSIARKKHGGPGRGGQQALEFDQAPQRSAEV